MHPWTFMRLIMNHRCACDVDVIHLTNLAADIIIATLL